MNLISNIFSRIRIKKFNSAIETTYGLLFIGSVAFMSISIWESFEWNVNNLEINTIIFFMLVVLISQMVRMYYVLHDLDNGGDNSDHFINLVQGGWVIYERILRLFLALIVILAVKYQSMDMVSTIVENWTFRVAGLIQYLSLHFPEILGQMNSNIHSYSKQSFLLAYYSLLMLLIYLVFWVWDMYVYLSAKAALVKSSSELNNRGQLRSFVEYLRPRGHSGRALQETDAAYRERLDKIVEEKTFSYFSSDKFYERLVGTAFFMSTLFFINANGNIIFLFACGIFTALFVRYNSLLDGGVFRWPFELILSVFKVK